MQSSNESRMPQNSRPLQPSGQLSGPGGASGLSGSEFALRVALCDLVERVKRSDEKCKYLELSRNEMAKEIVRLRHENESFKVPPVLDLVRNSQQVLHTEVDYTNRPGQVTSSQLEYQNSPKSVNVNIEPPAPSNDEMDDESWEQLTVDRLLREAYRFKQECAKNASNDRENHSYNSTESEKPLLNRIEPAVSSPGCDYSFIEKAAETLLTDYVQMANIVSFQNERLSRLKTSYLRTYFKRQISPNRPKLSSKQ